MSYRFLKISDTYDIRDVEEYTAYSEPRMSRDMWRDEVLGLHDWNSECCGVIYKICNEYKAERDVAERKVGIEELENHKLNGDIKALKEKVANLEENVANMELQNQQLQTEKEALSTSVVTDACEFVIVLLVGVLFGLLFRF